MAAGNKTLVLTPEQQCDLIDACNARIEDLRQFENPAADKEANRLEAILTELEKP